MEKSFLREVVETMYELGEQNAMYVSGNVFDISEWIKWLSYESEAEIKRRDYLLSKEKLTYYEHKALLNYFNNVQIKDLFLKYVNHDCTKEEYLRVCDYMDNTAIDGLIMSKLTNDEINRAKKKAELANYLSDNELYERVNHNKQKDNYSQLSMVDAYALHLMNETAIERSYASAQKNLDMMSNESDEIAVNSKKYSKNSKPCL